MVICCKFWKRKFNKLIFDNCFYIHTFIRYTYMLLVLCKISNNIFSYIYIIKKRKLFAKGNESSRETQILNASYMVHYIVAFINISIILCRLQKIETQLKMPSFSEIFWILQMKWRLKWNVPFILTLDVFSKKNFIFLFGCFQSCLRCLQSQILGNH